MNNKTYLALSLLVSLPLVASEQENSTSQEKREIDLKEQGETTLERSNSFTQLKEKVISATQQLEQARKDRDVAAENFETAKETFTSTTDKFLDKIEQRKATLRTWKRQDDDLGQEITKKNNALKTAQDSQVRVTLLQEIVDLHSKRLQNGLDRLTLEEEINAGSEMVKQQMTSALARAQSTSATTKESHE